MAMKPALFYILLFSVVLYGCNAAKQSASTPAPTPTPTPTPSTSPVSSWTGTYTGSLNFIGCGGVTPPASCGGDSISVAYVQAYDNPEFSTALTITGTDSTTEQAFTGTGTTLDISPAPSGPGTMGTNAVMTTSMGDSLSVVGNGSSQSSSPVLMQTVFVYNCPGPIDAQTASCGGGGAYLGTLTRTPTPAANPVLTSIVLVLPNGFEACPTPTTPSLCAVLYIGGSAGQIQAQALDQNKALMNPQPLVTWNNPGANAVQTTPCPSGFGTFPGPGGTMETLSTVGDCAYIVGGSPGNVTITASVSGISSNQALIEVVQ